MIVQKPARALIGLCTLIAAVALVPAPAAANPATKARLVHCAEGTCIRLSGQRTASEVSIQVAGQQLAVAGARRWSASVPLSVAKTWKTSSSGHSVTVSLVHPRLGVQASESVLLPPGALAGRLQVASLVVRAY